MKTQAKIIALTVLTVLLLDITVASVLRVAQQQGRLGALVQYFEYGRSVPGKIERWREQPGLPGNLRDVAWRDDLVAESQAAFATEADAPRVRTYGMSFVNDILRSASALDPDMVVDAHAGPAAPPNFTFAAFEDDAMNRRPGDVVVLGILSSSVHGMAALSNRTWLFEQPAPFTYPIYRPSSDGLTRIDPLVASLEDEDALRADPNALSEWNEQLHREDSFFSPVTFGGVWLDHSPFMRLVRRAFASGVMTSRSKSVLSQPADGGFPYEETLRRMAVAFSDRARADGQVPVVFLIQSRSPGDPDLRNILVETLESAEIPYLATADYYDVRNPSGFLADGHYRKSVNALFAEAFLELRDANGARSRD